MTTGEAGQRNGSRPIGRWGWSAPVRARRRRPRSKTEAAFGLNRVRRTTDRRYRHRRRSLKNSTLSTSRSVIANAPVMVHRRWAICSVKKLKSSLSPDRISRSVSAPPSTVPVPLCRSKVSSPSLPKMNASSDPGRGAARIDRVVAFAEVDRRVLDPVGRAADRDLGALADHRVVPVAGVDDGTPDAVAKGRGKAAALDRGDSLDPVLTVAGLDEGAVDSVVEAEVAARSAGHRKFADHLVVAVVRSDGARDPALDVAVLFSPTDAVNVPITLSCPPRSRHRRRPPCCW